MNIASALLFLAAIAAFVITVSGLFVRQRSIVIAVIALGVAVLAGGGAWYAWAESQSTGWTIGYLIVLVCAVASAARQFVGGVSALS